MLTLYGLREDLIGVTMFPATPNTRSDGVLVAQMHRYFLATVSRRGYLASLFQNSAFNRIFFPYSALHLSSKTAIIFSLEFFC